MGVVRREGKWTLEKEKEGLYAICKRKDKVANIVTDDYTGPNNLIETDLNPMMEKIYVSDFQEAEDAFKNYVESGGSGLIGGSDGLL